MAEEQRYQEGHRLCANNCGFVGSPATLNLCSKCYHDLRLKDEDQASSAKTAAGKSRTSSSSTSVAAAAASATMVSSPAITQAAAEPATVTLMEPTSPSAAEALPAQQQSNRCAACRKRLGLTGFRCRCGASYCGIHRYPERHGCGVDYKTAGRDAIARANPVVKADKLHRRI